MYGFARLEHVQGATQRNEASLGELLNGASINIPYRQPHGFQFATRMATHILQIADYSLVYNHEHTKNISLSSRQRLQFSCASRSSAIAAGWAGPAGAEGRDGHRFHLQEGLAYIREQ